MSLMVVYVVLLFIGQTCSFIVGTMFDMISKSAGVAAFLVLYFSVFVICWKIAVRLTAPDGLIGTRLSR